MTELIIAFRDALKAPKNGS